MKRASGVLLSALFLLVTSFPVFAASTYLGNVNNGVYWLSHNQNIDGSWGATDDVKMLCTVEAVTALQTANQRIPAYYWGVMWLENHCAPNSDYKARRILALAPHGDNLQADLVQLQSAQTLTSPGNNGWGLTSEYQGAALDSAMVLLATYKLGVTTNVQPALNYLKTAELTGTDKGWPVAQESSSDPMTTALVVSSLANYTALDSTLTTPIANGVATLTSTVTTASPIPLQALAALAYLRAGYSANASSLLSSMSGAQSSNGSWSNDPYATAVATRAFATAMGNAAPCLSNLVYMPDPYLRSIVNITLGKNGMDALTQCDMANLTTLNAAGMGISNLTGMEYAVNLTSADLRNNNITDWSPLNGLPLHPTVQTAGNPVAYPPSMPPGYDQSLVAVPALSLPGFIIAIIAAAFVLRKRRRQSSLGGIYMMIMMVAVMFAFSKPAPAADYKKSVKELDSKQLQQIQKIGQTVLAAKKSTPVDPELKKMHQKVKDLREAIAALDSLMHPIGTIPRVSSKTDGTQLSEALNGTEMKKVQAKREDLENKVRNVLTELRKQRFVVQAANEHDIPERSFLKREAASKAEKLENEVEEILNAPPAERANKLKALKERLSPTNPEQLTKSDHMNKTPTFSTFDGTANSVQKGAQ